MARPPTLDGVSGNPASAVAKRPHRAGHAIINSPAGASEHPHRRQHPHRCNYLYFVPGNGLALASTPSRLAARARCRLDRIRRSRFTSMGSAAIASCESSSAFSTW